MFVVCHSIVIALGISSLGTSKNSCIQGKGCVCDFARVARRKIENTNCSGAVLTLIYSVVCHHVTVFRQGTSKNSFGQTS